MKIWWKKGNNSKIGNQIFFKIAGLVDIGGSWYAAHFCSLSLMFVGHCLNLIKTKQNWLSLHLNIKWSIFPISDWNLMELCYVSCVKNLGIKPSVWNSKPSAITRFVALSNSIANFSWCMLLPSNIKARIWQRIIVWY